jgi:hypothetical protein
MFVSKNDSVLRTKKDSKRKEGRDGKSEEEAEGRMDPPPSAIYATAAVVKDRQSCSKSSLDTSSLVLLIVNRQSWSSTGKTNQ